MKPLPVLLAIVIATLCASQSFAQGGGSKKKEKTVTLYGGAYDSFTKVKVKAFVTLMSEDSTAIDTDTCYVPKMGNDSHFKFTLPKKQARYIFKATADGYEDTYVDYELKPKGRTAYFYMPQILMKKKADDDVYKSIDLNGVEIHGTRVMVAYRGDTIVYDAAAFNLPEGSMLESLVRQMPGAELKESGDIYVNGEKVDYLMLNGKDFFKGDNKVMLENLPYFTVKNIKVYHKSTNQSEMLGTDIEPKEYVMDVNLKREYAHGYLANAEAGVGTENRWMARAFGLYYDDYNRLSVFGNANNVNENRQPDSNGDWTPSKMTRGLLTTKTVGMNFNTENKEKTYETNVSAQFTWDDSDNERRTTSTTFATNGDIGKGRVNITDNNNFKWHIGGDAYFEKLGLEIDLNINYQNSNGTTINADSTYKEQTTNRSYGSSMSKSRFLNIQWQTYWAKKLPWGDRFIVDANCNYTNVSPSRVHGLSTTEYVTESTRDRRNNYFDNSTHSYGYALNGRYIFTVSKEWQIIPSLSYTQNYNGDEKSLYRLDWLGDSRYDDISVVPSTRDSLLMALDRNNSATTNTLTRKYSGGLAFQRAWNDIGVFRLDLPFSHYSEQLGYAKATLDTVAHRTYNEFAPTLRYSVYGRKSKPLHNYSFDVIYRQPDFTSLMPVNDTSNPLSMQINNPKLKAETRYNFKGRTRFRCDSIDMAWYFNVNAMYVHNKIGTRTTYNSTMGAYTYMNDNVNGNYELGAEVGLSGTLDHKKRLHYQFSTNVKYLHDVDFDVAYDVQTDALSKVNTVCTNINANLYYQYKKLTAGLVGKLTIRNSRSDRNDFKKIDVAEYQYGANLTYTVPRLDVGLSTGIMMFSKRGYETATMNTDDLVWNAQLSRTFFKGHLTAKITAYDILHQLSSTQYEVNAQGRTETWYKSIPHYVMFTLAYQFSMKPKKQ